MGARWRFLLAIALSLGLSALLTFVFHLPFFLLLAGWPLLWPRRRP